LKELLSKGGNEEGRRKYLLETCGGKAIDTQHE
jgi:hypothetical protein